MAFIERIRHGKRYSSKPITENNPVKVYCQSFDKDEFVNCQFEMVPLTSKGDETWMITLSREDIMTLYEAVTDEHPNKIVFRGSLTQEEMTRLKERSRGQSAY